MVRRRAEGYGHRDLPSQAGYDAYFMARICPTTMIFTPCQDGITHNNAEFTSRDEIAPVSTCCCKVSLRMPIGLD